jgi:hypothetical protein
MRQGSRREEVFFMLSELIRGLLQLLGIDDGDDDDDRNDRRTGDRRQRADRGREDRDDDLGWSDFGD